MNGHKIFGLLIATLLSCATSACASRQSIAPTPDEAFYLDQKSLERAMKRVESGDSRSMIEVANFYMFYKEDDAEGLKWFERAGDIGDENARNIVRSYYKNHKTAQSEKRLMELDSKWGGK